MSDDDEVIDLDQARERRKAGELPPRLRQGLIVRRGYLAQGFCAHRETEVDSLARIVRCRSCGVDLDAIDVLSTVAIEWERLAEAIKERARLEESVVKLRAEEKRIKARLKRVREKLPAVPDEVVAMRKCVEYLRGFSVGRSSSLVAAVDAAREGS